MSIAGDHHVTADRSQVCLSTETADSTYTTSSESTHFSRSQPSRCSSKTLLSRPASSFLPEVVDFGGNNDKEVSFADEKQVAGGDDKQVVKEENFPEAIDEEGDKEVLHKSSFSSTEKELSGKHTLLNRMVWDRRTKWTMAAILSIILLAIGLSIGLGLGLQKASSTSKPAPSSPQGVAQVIGGSLDSAYYSTEGAFNGTGMAVSEQSFAGGLGTVVLYFQHFTGQIRYMQLNMTSGDWFGGHAATIVASDAKNNTPIYAVSYVANYSSEWHVYYIDEGNMIRERYSSNETGIWQDGVINDLNIAVMDAEQAGFLACWYGSTYGDVDFGDGSNTTDGIGARLWYATNGTTFQQLGWRKSNNAWVYEEVWPNLNGHTSPGCYSWGAPPTTTYTAFVDLYGTSSIYWRDTAWNKISTSEHPINQWSNSSVAINDLGGAANLAYTNSLYGQSQSDHWIRGYNISWAAENTTLKSEFKVGDGPGVPGTRLAATELPSDDGSYQLVVFFQTNGSDITEFRRDVEGTTWTQKALPIPQI